MLLADQDKTGSAAPMPVGVSPDQSVSVDCSHCGLMVPPGLVESGAADQFCCQGCKTAFEIINECGLDAYYNILDSNLAAAPRSNEWQSWSDSELEQFRAESTLECFARNLDGNQYSIEMLLEGIHCAACVWLIEKLPRVLNGVLEVRVNWSKKTAWIRWDNAHVDLATIAVTMSKLGYQPHLIRDSTKARLRRKENRQHLIRIGVAGAAAGNNMLIAAALYLGMFSQIASDFETLLRIASCAIGVLALAWPGRVFLTGAWNSIRTRTPHMDLPIGLGLLVGTLAGLINTILGTGEIYFDSLTVLVFLLLVGRWLQFRQQGKAVDSVELLFRLTPRQARKQVNGQTVLVAVDEILIGDRLEVPAGELIPVDCLLLTGETHADEAILTGEARPVRKLAGDLLSAGTLNLDQTIVIRATAVGRDTRISKIIQLVENGSQERPAVVEWANRIGGYFVISVLLAAVGTFAFWVRFSWFDAIENSVALLIVACPCALALATPLSIAVAVGRAAANRIMIKSGDVFQRLNQPGLIWLDKTGTLTVGRLVIQSWYGDEECLNAIRAIEANSLHPVARAFQEYSSDDGRLLNADNVLAEADGISGTYRGKTYRIGNHRFLERNGISIDDRWRDQGARIIKQLNSPCWIACEGKVIAVVSIGDQLRSGSRVAIEKLQAAGWKLGILSGDCQAIVDRVANELAIPAQLSHGNMSPEAKLDLVRESMNKFETVVMVGDGVNDGAALAASSVGIAVQNGAEASLAAAPVYLARSGLAPLLDLMRISKRINRTMRRNFAISLSYNVGCASLAAAGFINPLIAAILMPVSSLSVIGLTLASGRKDTGEPR